jgi:recombination protein RecT
MANQQLVSVKSLLERQDIQSKFKTILKEKSAGFTANLAVMVSNSETLKKCDPYTIISAAVVSASLDLPLDPNLGFAAVVPYGDKASFQIMYKGIIQLAMRSGQYKTINVTEVYDGELKSSNRITGEYVFDTTQKKSEKVIGYAAYFKLLNGYEKTEYWPVDKVDRHGKRFSQTYKKGYGLWKDDFESMARKTVLKNLLSKWGILSIEMQKAIKFDQGVVVDEETGEVEYMDNVTVHTVDENPKAIINNTEPKQEPEQSKKQFFDDPFKPKTEQPE